MKKFRFTIEIAEAPPCPSLGLVGVPVPNEHAAFLELARQGRSGRLAQFIVGVDVVEEKPVEQKEKQR
jgi:hypothetical protein